MAIKNINNNTQPSKTGKITSWVETFMNPLAGMTKGSIERMLYQKRFGNDTRLQIAYSEVEANMPIFGITIDKRTAGILGRAWDIVADDDTPEAKKQADKIRKLFQAAEAKNKDGLTSAFEHLVLGAFRGRAAVKCFYEDDELKFKLLDNWNVLEWNGNLYWNPTVDEAALPKDGQLQQIPDEEVIYTTYDRPID